MPSTRNALFGRSIINDELHYLTQLVSSYVADSVSSIDPVDPPVARGRSSRKVCHGLILLELCGALGQEGGFELEVELPTVAPIERASQTE